MRSVFKASFIAVAATIVMLPVGAQSAGLLGDGGLLGTGIGTPTGALGTGLLASNDGGSSGGGVLGTGIGAPGGALGTGLLAGSGDVAGVANVKLGQNGGVLNATTADAKLAGVSTNLLVDLFGSGNPRAHVALGGGLLGDGLAIDLFGSGTVAVTMAAMVAAAMVAAGWLPETCVSPRSRAAPAASASRRMQNRSPSWSTGTPM